MLKAHVSDAAQEFLVEVGGPKNEQMTYRLGLESDLDQHARLVARSKRSASKRLPSDVRRSAAKSVADVVPGVGWSTARPADRSASPATRRARSTDSLGSATRWTTGSAGIDTAAVRGEHVAGDLLVERRPPVATAEGCG